MIHFQEIDGVLCTRKGYNRDGKTKAFETVHIKIDPCENQPI